MTATSQIEAAMRNFAIDAAFGDQAQRIKSGDSLRTLITQAIAEARADVWIPIASAPLDGTILQLWNCVTSETDIGHWSVRADGSGGEWSQEMGNGDMTHWRPLPAKREPVLLTNQQILTAMGAPEIEGAPAGAARVIATGKAIETAVLAANGLTK